MVDLYKKTAKYIAEHGGNENHTELYRYSMECLACLLIPALPILLSGILFNNLPNTIVWCLSFLLFRKFAGGAHAGSQLRCTIYSLLTAMVGIYFIPMLLVSIRIKTAIVLGSFLIFLLFAPCDHPNHPIVGQNRRKLKIRSLVLSAICFPFLTVDNFIGTTLSGIITSSMLVASSSVVVSKLQNK